MAKKTKKINAPKWLRSKWFLFGLALVISVMAIIGYKSFAGTIGTATCYINYNKYCPTVGYGYKTKGEEVKVLQYELNHVCATPPYEELVVDGVFGSKTYNALKTFQRSHKDRDGKALVVDGIAGSKTWISLNSEYNYRKSKGMLGICD